MNYWKILISYLPPVSVLITLLSSNLWDNLKPFTSSEIRRTIIVQGQVKAENQSGNDVDRRYFAAGMNPIPSVSQKNVKSYFKYAKQCEEAGHFEKAIEAYRHILVQQPDHSPTLLNLAILCYRKKQWKHTENLLLRANNVKPNYWKNYYLFALVKIAQGNREVALTHLERTLELSPDYEPAHRLMSKLGKSLL